MMDSEILELIKKNMENIGSVIESVNTLIDSNQDLKKRIEILEGKK